MSSLLLASACSLALFSTTPSLTQPNQSSLCTPQQQEFVDPFKQGRDLLRQVPVTHSARVVSYVEYLNGDTGPYPRRPDTDYEWRTIPIALRNTLTNDTRVIIITRHIENRKVPTAITSDDGQFILAVDARPSGTVWNWWNTPLTVVYPRDWVVTAIKWERQPSGETIITTPPASDLLRAFPLVFKQGNEHERQDDREAQRLLAHIPSRVKPGLSVAQFITRYLPGIVPSIISVEHADPYDMRAFRRGIGSFDPLLRAAALFGLNGDEAFASTRSSAGAKGATQLMPSTCSSMRWLYPVERIIPSGCTAPRHAHPIEIAAAMLTVDYHVSLLERSAHKRGITLEELLDRDDLQSLVLASYNGGPGRVGKFLKAKQWRTKLPSETQNYLAKYDQLRR